MHRDLLFESLHWCSRDDLESMQLACSGFHKMIVDDANVLPRRTLGRVDMIRLRTSRDGENGKKTASHDTDSQTPFQGVRQKGNVLFERVARWPPGANPDVALHGGDVEGTLQRLKHAFVKQFCFSFAHSADLQRIVANADIVVERLYDDLPRNPKPEDYALRDSIVDLFGPLAHHGPASTIYGLRRRYK